MPIDASIPLGVKQPDPFTPLKGMLDIASGVQNLQRGNIQLQQEQGALDANRVISEIISHPEMIDPATGNVDMNKFSGAVFSRIDPNNPAAMKVAKEAIVNASMANVETAKAKSALATLDDQQTAYVSGRLTAAAADQNITKQDVINLGNDIVSRMPQMKSARDFLLKGANSVPDNPEALRGFLGKVNRFALPASTQAPTTVGVPTGNSMTFAQPNPNSPTPVGPLVGSTPVPTGLVPPSGAETVKQDVLGNPYVEARTPDGHIYPKAMPGASAPPLLSFPPGEDANSFRALEAARTASNQRALAVPEQHFNNQQIIKLADATSTGEGAKIVANLRGRAAGIPWTTDTATNYDRLGHFIALESQANAKAMGAGTDAARAVSEKAVASEGWTRDAIKSAVKINDALTTGVDYFNRGIEAAVNNPQNTKSIYAARDFQNAWAQNFDVNAMRLLNASKNGDKTEVKEIINSVGGANSPAAKALAQKIRNLDKLSTEGRL